MTYKGYTIQNYIKIVGFVVSWLLIVSELCIGISNIGTEIVKIVEVNMCKNRPGHYQSNDFYIILYKFCIV